MREGREGAAFVFGSLRLELLEDCLLGWLTGRALRASRGLVIVPS